VLGASDQPDRYSNKAVKMLLEHGHHVIPIHPALKTVESIAVVANLSSVAEPVDTLTLYLGPDRLEKLVSEIVQLAPKRVIFNPGTESPVVEQALDQADIAWQEACTLVLLRTGQF
jgi:hypothetical protein